MAVSPEYAYQRQDSTPEKKAFKWLIIGAVAGGLIAGVPGAVWAGIGAGGISWVHEKLNRKNP